MMLILLLSCFERWCLLGDNLDLANHAGFVVAWQQAGEIKLTDLVEVPDDLALFGKRPAIPS